MEKKKYYFIKHANLYLTLDIRSGWYLTKYKSIAYGYDTAQEALEIVNRVYVANADEFSNEEGVCVLQVVKEEVL